VSFSRMRIGTQKEAGTKSSPSDHCLTMSSPVISSEQASTSPPASIPDSRAPRTNAP
jgi:hypothetical protein